MEKAKENPIPHHPFVSIWGSDGTICGKCNQEVNSPIHAKKQRADHVCRCGHQRKRHDSGRGRCYGEPGTECSCGMFYK